MRLLSFTKRGWYLMLMRSFLYVPGDNQKFLDKVESSNADAIILDLEDSVKFDSKEIAENTLREFLKSTSLNNLILRVEPSRIVNVLDLINHPKISKIYLPKADSKQAVDALNEQNSAKKPIHAIIESSIGLEKLSEIACMENVQSLGIGEADFLAEISLSDVVHESLKSYARSRIVIASAAYKLQPPVAPVSSNFKDLRKFESETKEFLEMGYWGRACIHPAQVDIANSIFTPDEKLKSKAEIIINALEKSSGGAAVDDEGKMVDAAHLRWAQRYRDLF
ncbi:MAG: CoA ester lyase [Candidatus Nanopelagicaceae bacterium]|nr:CoA ester lyase [Candidatus Nanopelagicaceae bacterium]